MEGTKKIWALESWESPCILWILAKKKFIILANVILRCNAILLFPVCDAILWQWSWRPNLSLRDAWHASKVWKLYCHRRESWNFCWELGIFLLLSHCCYWWRRVCAWQWLVCWPACRPACWGYWEAGWTWCGSRRACARPTVWAPYGTVFVDFVIWQNKLSLGGIRDLGKEKMVFRMSCKLWKLTSWLDLFSHQRSVCVPRISDWLEMFHCYTIFLWEDLTSTKSLAPFFPLSPTSLLFFCLVGYTKVHRYQLSIIGFW